MNAEIKKRANCLLIRFGEPPSDTSFSTKFNEIAGVKHTQVSGKCIVLTFERGTDVANIRDQMEVILTEHGFVVRDIGTSTSLVVPETTKPILILSIHSSTGDESSASWVVTIGSENPLNPVQLDQSLTGQLNGTFPHPISNIRMRFKAARTQLVCDVQLVHWVMETAATVKQHFEQRLSEMYHLVWMA